MILEKPSDMKVLVESGDQNKDGKIPQLPVDIMMLVYHGQHRVAACNQLTDPEEHWWFAEIYSPGRFVMH